MRKFLLPLVLLLLCTQLFAQKKIITGTVTEKATGEPLIGVNVVLFGTLEHSGTNEDGKYALEVLEEGGSLIFSYVGFESDTIAFTNQTTLDAAMALTSKTLDGVVVVGYGTQIKSKLTGSISSVSGDDIAGTPVTSVEQALQGRAAGVFVESNNGKVGSAIRVRVRGSTSINANNEPLYVVDGIPINTAPVNDGINLYLNPLNDIDFNNIESIEILKDASASAIYGSRGANGVILITTKRGSPGKTKVNFEYQQGWSEPTRLRNFLDAQQYVSYFEEAATNAGKYDFANEVSGYATEQEAIDDYLATVHEQFDQLSGGTDWQNNAVNTDWQSLAFQKATSRDIHLNFSGGTDKLQYFVSGGYLQQEGIMIENAMTRGSLLINIDNKVSNKFDFGINLNISRSLNNDIPNDNYFESPMQIVAQCPLTPVYDSMGNYSTEPTTLYFNPLLETVYSQSNIYTFRTIGNVYADYNITNELKLRGEAGADITFLTQDRYSGSGSNFGQSVGGYGEVFNNHVENYDLKLLLSYNKIFKQKHELEATAGTEYEPYTEYYSKVDGQGFPNDDLKTLASAATIVYGTSFTSYYRFLSYFGRINYNYDKKYLLSLTGRYDGSSRFGQDNRYGFFPSASAGWVLSEEPFLKGNNTFSFLKLRSSYGITGNAGIGNFNYLGLYGVSSYNGTSGLYPSTLANPDLTWEKTAQFDVGIDYGFFGDRINGEIDYYIKNTSDLLLEVPVPSTTGFTTQLQNIGKMRNAGFEFVINTDLLVKKFKWNASINFATNKNEVTALSNGQTLIDNGGSEALNVVMVGEPIGIFYGAEYAGVDVNNGDALWYINDPENPSDATTNDFNAANFVVVGDPNPNFIAGITNSFSYKQFSLDFSLQSVVGNDVNLNGDYWMASNGSQWDNQITDMQNSWQNPGDVTDVPQERLFFTNGSQFRNSRYISDASYLRLKTLTLSYSLPKKMLGKAKISSLRIYTSAYNLLTFTNYTGWDPEVTTDIYADNVNVGVDFYSAPQPRTIVFGISLGL
ncbi:MAG: TonB-dependent receptor [Chitinophagales bacterium]|nr:TonB-dependent receptor [Chitinophagales bacterium]